MEITTQKEILLTNPKFLEFVAEVRQQLDDLLPDEKSMRESLELERRRLNGQCRGWKQSLGNPDLSGRLRQEIENDWTEAIHRIESIDQELAGLATRKRQLQEVVTPELVAERISDLATILAGANASATNVMLAQHIDGIYCNVDGRVVLRTCKLGAIAGGIDLVPQTASPCSPPLVEGGNDQQGMPRRRARRDVGAAIEDDDVATSFNEVAVDPYRFAGLGSEWFSETVLQVPRRLSWAEEHAREVAEFRLDNQATMEATANHFGKTVPTIRAALNHARELHGIEAFGRSVSKPRRPHWAKDHADEVAAFVQEGKTLEAASRHFGKSQPTISKALRFARASGDAEQLDGESVVG
jgi:transposase-like protein